MLHFLDEGVDALVVAPEVGQHPRQMLHGGDVVAPLGRHELNDEHPLHLLVLLTNALLRLLESAQKWSRGATKLHTIFAF